MKTFSISLLAGEKEAVMKEAVRFDVHAAIEASRLLEKSAKDDVPAPVRRMLIHAQHKLDDEIEAYFKPAGAD